MAPASHQRLGPSPTLSYDPVIAVPLMIISMEIHGISMEYLWNIFGTSMANLYGISIEDLWNFYGSGDSTGL